MTVHRLPIAIAVLAGLAAPGTAQTRFTPTPAPVPAAAEAIGPWSLLCRRAGNLGGRAFESCEASATLGPAELTFSRDSRGIIGLVSVHSCKTVAKGTFRIDSRSLQPTPKRAPKFAKAVNAAMRLCGLPEAVFDDAQTEQLLQRSDGLSSEWVG